MRKKLLLGLGLSLATGIFAACGDPGDAATAGDYDDGSGLEDGGATGAQGDGGVDEGTGSRPFGGVGDLGGGSSSRSRAARAALAMGGAFDVATLEALVGARRVVPFSTPGAGTVSGVTIGPVSSGLYAAYLNLAGFTNADGDLRGLLIRVNTGTTAPVAGCTTAGTFPAADQGTSSTTPQSTFTGGNFSLTGASKGSGSVRLSSLTIPTGTSASYAVRICAVDTVTGTVNQGTAHTFNVTTDITKPADGDIGTNTLASSTVVVVPISGFTDDRAIDHLEVRVRAGLVNPTSGCTGTATSTPAEIPVTVASSSLAAAGIVGAVPYISAASTGSTLTVTVPGITVGKQYSMRICAVDVAGNTAGGATGRVTVKATSTIPASPTFGLNTTATTETIFNSTSVQATTAAYAAATLTVQCPNPLATATLSEAELGTITRTAPPFGSNGRCTMEPTVVCSGPRCTATSVGVTDLCPKSGKRLALAITCDVATLAFSSMEAVGVSGLDSLNASVPTVLVLSCTNPAEIISYGDGITADYGDPVLNGAGLVISSSNCTARDVTSPLLDYTAAKAALLSACNGKRSCTVPQGLAATAVVPGFVAPSTALDCPTRKTTAATIFCSAGYAASPAFKLSITAGMAATEICISNSPLTSAGATALTRGDCATGWLPLSGAGEVNTALTAGTHSFTLSGGDGLKTLYVKVHDAAFNESAVVTSQVRMDTIAPVRQGMLARADSATQRALTNRISWNRFADSGSGIASYKLVYTSDGSLPPSDCSATTSVKVIGVGSVGIRGWRMNAGATSAVRTVDEPPTAQVPFFHSEEYNAAGAPLGTLLTAGSVYTYRVCATDRVGHSSTLAVSTATVAAGPTVSGTATGVTPVNYAPGATSTCVAAPSYTAPTLGGSFTLQDNDGAITALTKNWTNSVYVTAVTGSLTPTGGVGPYEYCFSGSNQASSCTTSMWKTASTTIANAGVSVHAAVGRSRATRARSGSSDGAAVPLRRATQASLRYE